MLEGLGRMAFAFLLSLLVAAAQPAAAVPGQGHIETPDGVRLFYKVVGQGPDTLVVVHGGPGNSLSSVESDYAPLAARRRIIYYDQRGGGRSDLIAEDEKLSL